MLRSKKLGKILLQGRCLLVGKSYVLNTLRLNSVGSEIDSSRQLVSGHIVGQLCRASRQHAFRAASFGQTFSKLSSIVFHGQAMDDVIQ